MGSDNQDHRLLYKVAKAYYEDNLTQQQIGGRFGLSRVKISRMLSRAKQSRIVQISITPPLSSNVDLERKIESKYGLKEAVIITPTRYETDTVVSELGLAGAQYLLRCLQGSEVIAISWGNTLLAVVDALPAENLPRVRVVQIIGGLGELEAKFHGAELTRRMAQTIGARPRLLHAPGIVKKQNVRNALVNDPQVSGTLKLAASADIALVGIGAFHADSTLSNTRILTKTQTQALDKSGATGDIALRFFDENGDKVKTAIDSRIVGLGIDAIKKIPRVIGVAGGKNKTEVIRAAIRGKLINVLITDEQVAISLLKDE
ncbi:MAG: sugar-binding transcriptional regulator [Sedimentisphaerales bacterium]|nr:sugar-binding transcriptional regulator [Sedimentisphaerales bacterium]